MQCFQYEIPTSEERSESSYQVRQIFALFSNLIALALGQNSVKSLRVTKILKKIKYEGVWDQLETKRFANTISYKIFETDSSFHVKKRITGKV